MAANQERRMSSLITHNTFYAFAGEDACTLKRRIKRCYISCAKSFRRRERSRRFSSSKQEFSPAKTNPAQIVVVLRLALRSKATAKDGLIHARSLRCFRVDRNFGAHSPSHILPVLQAREKKEEIQNPNPIRNRISKLRRPRRRGATVLRPTRPSRRVRFRLPQQRTIRSGIKRMKRPKPDFSTGAAEKICIKITQGWRSCPGPYPGMWGNLVYSALKPIRLRGGSGGFISCRTASKTTLNCLSYLLSSSKTLRARPSTERAMRRRRTNARTTATLI